MNYLRILRVITPKTRLLYQQQQFTNLPTLTLCRINYEQRREYKDFGHKPEKEHIFSKIWYMILLTLIFISVIDWRWLRLMYLQRMEKRQEKKLGIENSLTKEKSD